MFGADFHNPDDNWGYDPYKGMDDDERVAAGCMSGLAYIIAMVIGVLICSLFSSCTTTQYVPVPEVHEIYHNHTDSVIKQDSVIHEKETTIMQLDSAAMAQYGIKLKAAERAWLVKTKELERQIERLMEMSATKDSAHDSIPVPYEVVKEVPRKRSTVDWVLTIMGMLSILGIIVWVVNKVKRFLPGVNI